MICFRKHYAHRGRYGRMQKCVTVWARLRGVVSAIVHLVS